MRRESAYRPPRAYELEADSADICKMTSET